jgi:hypothetical protein
MSINHESIFVLRLHSDTCEPYESYPQVELLAAFPSYPTKVQIYKALRERLPNEAGVVAFAAGDGACWNNTLYTEPCAEDYYGSSFNWVVEEIGGYHEN